MKEESKERREGERREGGREEVGRKVGWREGRKRVKDRKWVRKWQGRGTEKRAVESQ